MRNLRRLAWVAVAAAATATPAAAQVGGNAGTNTGGNLGNFQTAQTAPTSAITTSSNSGGTSSGSLGTQAKAELAPVEVAPKILAPSKYATATGGGGTLQGSNFLAATYANPYYSGVLSTSRTGTLNPGGFGALTFSGAGGAKAATTPTTGGQGGGRGGSGGTFATDPGGQIVQLPRQIAYTAQLKFTPPTIPAPRLQADLRGLIDRAGLTVPAGSVQVQVDGSAVVLRGTVRDDDEARLVEGLVRLTPGVSRITNELSYPR